MEKYGWILLVVLAGACLPVQAGLNARIGKSLGSPLSASFVSFAVGALALLIVMVATRQTVNLQQVAGVPKYAWTSGLFGAFYVLMVIIAYRKLGVPMTFGLVVAGQMVMSLFLDHQKILVEVQHPINLFRVVGVLLIVTGVILIRNF